MWLIVILITVIVLLIVTISYIVIRKRREEEEKRELNRFLSKLILPIVLFMTLLVFIKRRGKKDLKKERKK